MNPITSITEEGQPYNTYYGNSGRLLSDRYVCQSRQGQLNPYSCLNSKEYSKNPQQYTSMYKSTSSSVKKMVRLGTHELELDRVRDGLIELMLVRYVPGKCPNEDYAELQRLRTKCDKLEIMMRALRPMNATITNATLEETIDKYSEKLKDREKSVQALVKELTLLTERQNLTGVGTDNGSDGSRGNWTGQGIPDLGNMTEDQLKGIFAQINQEQFEEIGANLLERERVECQKYYDYARTARFLSLAMRTGLGSSDTATVDDVKNLMVSLSMFHDPLAAYRDRALYVMAATYNSSRIVLNTKIQKILDTLGSNGSNFNLDANHLYFFYGVGVPKWFDDMVGVLCGEIDKPDERRNYFKSGAKIYPTQVNGENKLFKTFSIRRMVDQTVQADLKYMVAADLVDPPITNKTTFFNTELNPVKIRTYGPDTAYHFSQFNRCFGLHKYQPVNSKEINRNGRRLKGGGVTKGIMGEVRPSLFTDIELLVHMAMMHYYPTKMDYYEKFVARIYDVITNELDVVIEAVTTLVRVIHNDLTETSKLLVSDTNGIVVKSGTNTTGAISLPGMSASTMQRTQQCNIFLPPVAGEGISQQKEIVFRDDPLPSFFVQHIKELVMPIRIRHSVMNLDGGMNEITSTLFQRSLRARGFSPGEINRHMGTPMSPIRINDSSCMDSSIPHWTDDTYKRTPFGAIINFDEDFLRELKRLKRSEAISDGIWASGLKKGLVGSPSGPECASQVYPLTELTTDQINKLPTLRSLYAQIAGAALVMYLDSMESGISACTSLKRAVRRILEDTIIPCNRSETVDYMTSFEVRPGMLTAFSIGSVQDDKNLNVWNGYTNYLGKKEFYEKGSHRRALLDSFGTYIHHMPNMKTIPPFYNISRKKDTFERLSPGLYGLNSVKNIIDRDKAHMTDLDIMEDILDTTHLNRWLDSTPDMVLDHMIAILAHTQHDRSIVKAAFMNYAISSTLRGTENEEATKYLLSPPNFYYGNGSIDFYTDPANSVVPAFSKTNLAAFPSGLMARKHHIDKFLYTSSTTLWHWIYLYGT